MLVALRKPGTLFRVEVMPRGLIIGTIHLLMHTLETHVQLDPGGGSRAHTDLQLLKSAAPVLLDLLVEHQAEHGSAPLGVGTGAGGLGSSWAATRCGTVRPTFLVKAGILAEAHAAAARYLGTGNELQAWSCTAAHMLHAWGVLKACQGAAAT